jgi:hypothetical protein
MHDNAFKQNIHQSYTVSHVIHASLTIQLTGHTDLPHDLHADIHFSHIFTLHGHSNKHLLHIFSLHHRHLLILSPHEP